MTTKRRDARHVFHELTRSICPECRRVIDAEVVFQDNQVYLRKRCPQHGRFEALVYADAEAYAASARINKPGSIPLAFSTDVVEGCPYDCGLCPEHQQHACVGIIEVNSACNMDCPLCFADAGAGFNLTLQQVEGILDHFVETEGGAEVVQFSGGEPTIHPQIIPMLKAAKARDIRQVMLNTNGKRIAHDDAFLSQLAEVRPAIYFQFDGFEPATYETLRAEAGILDEKLRALDRLASTDCQVVLVPAIERGVNDHEIGNIIRFALQHPAVRGVNFQPAFHAGRHGEHDPLNRMTNPDILRALETQTDGMFRYTDFVPIPCCFPTCNSVTYAYVEDGKVTPLPRLIKVDDYLDYIANRAFADLDLSLKTALESLWSTSAVPGTEQTTSDFALTCAACGLDTGSIDTNAFAQRIFVVMLQDFMDPWTFNQKNVMKCCKEILLPDGKQVPFCAYNNLGYREQARTQLAAPGRKHTLDNPLRFVFSQRDS